MEKHRSGKSGFTLIEIMIVIAIVGLLAAVAIPSFLKARESSQKQSCIRNLKTLDGAKEQWAIENKKRSGSAVDTSGVASYIKGGTTPICPSGGTYSYNAVDTHPACSISGHTI